MAVRPTAGSRLREAKHAAVMQKVAFDGRDRARLERLCRYVARPPLSQERLSMHRDGRVKLSFKAAWKDGTHAVLLDPLAASSARPALRAHPAAAAAVRVGSDANRQHSHMTRYHGVLAGRASARAEVVPGRAPAPVEAQLPLFTPSSPVTGLRSRRRLRPVGIPGRGS